jgi:hypothetical protein
MVYDGVGGTPGVGPTQNTIRHTMAVVYNGASTIPYFDGIAGAPVDTGPGDPITGLAVGVYGDGASNPGPIELDEIAVCHGALPPEIIARYHQDVSIRCP